MPRPCTATVEAFLDGWTSVTPATVCDLYTFTLDGGEILRYSGWQRELMAPAPETDDPLIAFPLGPPLKRTHTKLQVGVAVDQLNIEVYAHDNDLVLTGGIITWQDAMRGGLFDGAYLDLWRCFMSPPRSVVGTIRWFYGRVSDVDVGRTKITIQVKSLLDLLNVQMPRRLFQAACNHVFGGTMCGFDRSTLEQTVTAELGTIQSQIVYSIPAPSPLNLFDNGTLTGSTGANTGYQRTITRMVDGVIYVLHPWVFPIVVGDTFTILPGCPHTTDACENTFDNLDRFGGFPYVPPPENAV